MLGQHVVKYFHDFEEAVLMNQVFDGVELVRDVVVFCGVDEPQSADVGLEF